MKRYDGLSMEVIPCRVENSFLQSSVYEESAVRATGQETVTFDKPYQDEFKQDWGSFSIR